MVSNAPVIFCKKLDFTVLCRIMTRMSNEIMAVNMTHVPSIVGRSHFLDTTRSPERRKAGIFIWADLNTACFLAEIILR